MRARKNPLPLTLDNVLSTLVLGRPYTVEAVALTFGSSRGAALDVLAVAVASGQIVLRKKTGKNRRDMYFIPEPAALNVATRRLQPGDMKGEFTYDLMSLQRLCMATRRV